MSEAVFAARWLQLLSENVLIFRLADHPARIDEALLPNAISLLYGYVITEVIHACAVNPVRHLVGHFLILSIRQRHHIPCIRRIVAISAKKLVYKS